MPQTNTVNAMQQYLLYFTLHAPPNKEWEPQSGANERLIGKATHTLQYTRDGEERFS
jgi:hypothetical protein